MRNAIIISDKEEKLAVLVLVMQQTNNYQCRDLRSGHHKKQREFDQPSKIQRPSIKMTSFLLRQSKSIAGAVRSSYRPSAPAARMASAFLCRGQASPLFLGSRSGVFSCHRPFSTSTEILSEILAKELQEEIDEQRDTMPEDLKELKSTIEQDWKIVDDGALTRLVRSIGGSKVVLTFHCQDTVEGLEEQYIDEVDEEPAVPFRFEILVSKAGNTLVLNCISNAGVTTVDGAAMTSDSIESLQSDGLNKNQYQGPEFSELSEELQNAFQEYVFESIGVNDDVGAFVSMYADYKEQVEYIGFLKSAVKVL